VCFSGRLIPLPEDLNVPRDAFMEEHALLDLTDGDHIFDPEDRLLFHALGPHGWAAEYDLDALAHVALGKRQTPDETVYWITWGGSFSSPPRRMGSRFGPADTSAAGFAQKREGARTLRREQRRQLPLSSMRTAGSGNRCAVAGRNRNTTFRSKGVKGFARTAPAR
jgi:hypothetical protein